ncbi:hypothetical protein [Aquirhabdus sp.]|uniref:hypothetical protein n=1 Tax=Aquirhabdus sp. TaxID=2824160 RepID=UPI00396C850E
MSDSFNFPIYFKRTLLTDAVVKSVDITRYAVKHGHPDKHKVALSTDAGMCFIEQGVSNWAIDHDSLQGMVPWEEDIPPMVRVRALWYTATDALRADIRVVSGGNANVFGGMGALLVPDGFAIPTVMASPENVKFYGLELIENKKPFTVRSEKVDIVMMKYDYTAFYKKEYLMQEQGGGGMFLETHEFPHIHIPLTKDCGGYIVIGRHLEADLYCFTAFQIPFGYGLYTPSNTIHGDGTLVGEFGLTVADSGMISADTILIYNENTLQMAQDIVPDWIDD